MEHEEIIRRVTKIVYNPKDDKSDNFAVQLLIEKLCIPKHIQSYNEKELEYYINRMINFVESDNFVTVERLTDI